MYSFEKYRKYFLGQLLLDICFILATTSIAVFVVRNRPIWDDKFFPWLLALVFIFGLLRLLVLFLWILKRFLKENLWVVVVAVIHFFILGACVYWLLFLAMLFGGVLGITPDGTEHRY